MVAREKLSEKYTEAKLELQVPILLSAISAAIAVTENEGNARLSTALPKTHIVIVGIEKIIPSLTDLALFWPLLATFGTGQKITVYNSIITGPKQPGETRWPRRNVCDFTG